MKRFLIVLTIIFAISLTTGCVSRTVNLSQGFSPEIAVLSLGTDTSMLDQDQSDLLDESRKWMDTNLVQALGRKGFRPTLINSESDFTGSDNGYLLKFSITDHKMISEGVKYFVGSLAGTDRIGAHFDLVDSDHKTVLSWDDTQASKHGVNYCARTINLNAVNKIVNYFSQL